MPVQQKQHRVAPLHFRRLELKYLLPDRLVPVFADRIAPYTQPDPYLIQEAQGRSNYPVTSLYFDSVDLQSLREKDAGLLSRRKLRLRTYEEQFREDRPAFLEIKRRHDFIISKDRLSLSVGHLNDTLPMTGLLRHILDKVEASEEVTHEANILAGWYNLQPTAFVSYRRYPLVGMQDSRFRITIDRNLLGAWKPQRLFGDAMLRPCHPGYSVIELKCNHSIPVWFHDAIQDMQLVRVSHSKYGMCVRWLRDMMAECS